MEIQDGFEGGLARKVSTEHAVHPQAGRRICHRAKFGLGSNIGYCPIAGLSLAPESAPGLV